MDFDHYKERRSARLTPSMRSKALRRPRPPAGVARVASNDDARSDASTAAYLFAAAIRERRRALGLTQADLARLAGCGLAFLYVLEAGKSTVRFDKLIDVLHVLGLSLRLELGHDVAVIDASLSGERDES